MTPKEKAQDLFDLYIDLMGFAHWNGVPVSVKLNKIMAINCALIAVDEVLQLCWNGNLKAQQYWMEVKQEIEKL
jgi:hypothetical protein